MSINIGKNQKPISVNLVVEHSIDALQRIYILSTTRTHVGILDNIKNSVAGSAVV